MRPISVSMNASILCVTRAYLCIFSPHPQNEEDSGEDSEEDDGFFVPHGYLSEGEGEQSDGEVANVTDNVSSYSYLATHIVTTPSHTLHSSYSGTSLIRTSNIRP